MSVAHKDSRWAKLAKRRVNMARLADEPCAACGGGIDYSASGHSRLGPTADHPNPIALGGDMLPSVEALNVMHMQCARRQGGKVTAAKRRMRPMKGGASFGSTGESPARSLEVCVPDSVREVPTTLSASPRDPGPTDGLPRYFSPPHPEAVASRGDEMVEYAERRRDAPLRWFQWLTAQRRYEVRADGTWCWPLVFESAPRQQGKSVTLTEDSAWYASTTVDPELILHTAFRVKTSLKVQSNLWRWAESNGMEVRRLLGDSHIIWPNGTDWATIALDSAYGVPAHRLLADEAWAMDPERFWNSIFPTLGDRDNPQVLFWSTANPDERGLVADLRKDLTVLRMEWGIILGAEDPMDPATWRASSAYWGPGRERLMRTASTRPGFAAEWLNAWPEVSKGEAAPPLPAWPDLPKVSGDPPYGCLVAVDEAYEGSGAGVAAFDGKGFWYRECGSVEKAIEQAIAWTNGEIVVGMSLRNAVPAMGVAHPVPYGARQTGIGLPLLIEAVKKRRLAHEHTDDLIAAAEGVRTRMSDAGMMSLSVKTSKGSVLPFKLLSWLLLRDRDAPEEIPAVW